MKRILLLSFYYPPDLSAGSFRTGALIEALAAIAEKKNLQIDLITTHPNRYADYQISALDCETKGCITINRIKIPAHQGGFFDQAKSYSHYFFKVLKITKKNKYDIVYAVSGRLFTTFLGARIASKKNIPLFLDVRDIFTDTMESLLKFPMKLLLPLFYLIENYTVKKASALNLVSPGFLSYYKVNKNCAISTISNGIDGCFYNIDFTHEKKNRLKRVVYAGNFGKGQALEKIIPALASATTGQCEFLMIGSGGQLEQLRSACANLENVYLISPVKREKLIQYYQDADMLLLHLDDLTAFQKVLPSKIFEYGITGKPILAGVSGYAAEFLNEHVSGSYIFPPCDIVKGIEQLNVILNSDFKKEDRTGFYKQFNREKLMNELAEKITSI
ncbi:MAG: glycosyltransferase [Gammaproteobacteria bacterium]|nr:glycosyltransferase [Gammaproteobacteria bacterium]